MVLLTEKEREAALILLKEFTKYYNANSISKVLGITHVGAQKILKRLLNENLLISERIGKSIVYKLKLDDDYVKKLLIFLLADEANHFKRWKEEFSELFNEGRIIIIYGSALRNYNSANDIDIMIVINKNEHNEVNKFLNKKQTILPKKLHAIKLTSEELLENIKNKAMIDIITNGIVLYGQEEYIEVINNATRL